MGFYDYDDYYSCDCCKPSAATVAALLKAQSELATMKAFHTEQAKTIKMLSDKNERLKMELADRDAVVDFLWAKLVK